MPTYCYRCIHCGHFDVRRAMAERAEQEPCPSCGWPAPRVVTAPALRRTSTGLRRALTASERSADAPEVVTTVPRSPRATPVTTDPRHLRLPRP